MEYVFGYGLPDADRAAFLPLEERRATPTVTVEKDL